MNRQKPTESPAPLAALNFRWNQKVAETLFREILYIGNC